MAVLTGSTADPNLLMIVRGREPFEGQLALPGGFVEKGERVVDAAARELREETGIVLPTDSLTQLGAYGDPGRDPRMRVVSVVFYAWVDEIQTPVAGDDARDVVVLPLEQMITDRPVAFDHRSILSDLQTKIA